MYGTELYYTVSQVTAISALVQESLGQPGPLRIAMSTLSVAASLSRSRDSCIALVIFSKAKSRGWILVTTATLAPGLVSRQAFITTPVAVSLYHSCINVSYHVNNNDNLFHITVKL